MFIAASATIAHIVSTMIWSDILISSQIGIYRRTIRQLATKWRSLLAGGQSELQNFEIVCLGDDFAKIFLEFCPLVCTARHVSRSVNKIHFKNGGGP